MGIRIYQVFEYQQHLKNSHQLVIKLPKMGSTCLKIPITTNDINLNEEVVQELNQSNQQKKDILKIIDESVCSDDEIQLTSHSFEEIQENSNQSKYSMIKKLDQGVNIKSILKTTTNSHIVQTSSIRKSVSFCLIAPNKYKEMINCSAKLSPAQKEFLDSLCSSQ
ncbi:unnamed protein product (macronuclear) [Paramecium tetraurelia]|uniref:Uncharacterized protein n=1 Tax=Paramecium tetraurelia TaxID=5888 RepID=A0D5K3_PARTE|nr:uncharacterized protein GSPATT00013750001 [Paramecium tetraurelia]CAK78320.1 unnamed protein product [Paramecium tetraurelia]|eukprot:XP_001445717.1 hypothetical protein (macronuclear) [Paramecium tetraurelia strain d4-2]